MSRLGLRLPESLHRMVRDVAAEESISINQFIAAAVAEKVSALLAEEYLEQRARRTDPAAFDPGDEREHPKPRKRTHKRVPRRSDRELAS